MHFTVVIPTYNGASRLPLVLERLRQQMNTEHLAWEIIVVDNNSQDNTAQIVRDYQANWPEKFPLTYCLEMEQGVAFARLHAVREAKGELIGFLDDDNLPDSNWVVAAYSFAKAHPKAGAFGGQIHGDFEVKPPENFQKIQSFLAIREQGEKPRLYEPNNLSLPPGAAVVVRKKAWCEAVPNRPKLIGRVGKQMLGGEDLEPLLYIHNAGWEIWYNPAMHTYHQIPQWRLEKDYLIALIRGSSLCICHLRLINSKTWQKPIIMAKIFLGSLRRTILHLLKYGGKVKNDLIPACEMEFYLSSLASPIYFIKTSLASQLTGYTRKNKDTKKAGDV
ncbi:glycosyltransferase family 2 protein [Planktothrix sp. FACHB-1355]|uniref:Glycosyltransferase family 2 protein n=1 Tax=Aerosakkonema funiforme FACHB-1375 TaxID=2949571 RepID=A0A926ZH35_9CYAN|nr:MULTISPECIES: hormogonium polysaccharide biosynthesis glycosyltransferase HpsE [Oscillatoriales]MBD2180486.1 glycosyltransferase family 2 protein [Aerosakkonema funiforme FACHB-1375]MBD3563304.1 glycosyltransferase family 2 protein [Planktothrix sp. FACHB-1355]